MKSSCPDHPESLPAQIESRALIDACSIEIAAQALLLLAVVVPIAMVIFPAALIAFGLSILANILGELSADFLAAGSWVQQHWLLLGFAAGVAIVAFSAVSVSWSLADARHTRVTERRLRPPSGRAGDKLIGIVADLWRGLPRSAGNPPRIFWFPNFNVMASAAEGGNSREILVSSALWERAVQGNAVAVGILAHEMAHLVFHDARMLRLLEGLAASARRVLSAVVFFVLVVAVLQSGRMLVGGARGEAPIGEVFLQQAAVFVFASLVLIVPILAMLAIRRQAALVTALVEIRADACGGLWTNGLGGFAQALSIDPDLRASPLSDLRHSLLSPGLTHVSPSERIELLRDMGRLATPKMRYFALTLALPFLLPVNPFTPLLEAGAFDFIFIAFVVVAAHVTTVGMVIAGAMALPTPLTWKRAATLAAFLCVATVLPRVNLYEIGYLLTHLAAGVVQPGGFGAEPLTRGSVSNDIAISLGGLWDKLRAASGGSAVLVAVFFSALALRSLSLLARAPQNRLLRGPRLWGLPTICAGAAAAASAYDEWRFFSLPAGITDLITLSNSIPWLRLCASELAAVFGFAVQTGLRSFRNSVPN
jgi:hypothetical protein